MISLFIFYDIFAKIVAIRCMQFGKNSIQFLATILVVILDKFVNLRSFVASKTDRSKDIPRSKKP